MSQALLTCCEPSHPHLPLRPKALTYHDTLLLLKRQRRKEGAPLGPSFLLLPQQKSQRVLNLKGATATLPHPTLT